MSGSITATAYIQIRKNNIWGKAVRMTQNYPSVIEPGCIVVKVKFTVPNDWYQIPFVTVSLPEPDKEIIATEVEAGAP